MNDGKNMAGMVSEKVQACGDGFCDHAAREQAKMKAAIHERMRAVDSAQALHDVPMVGLDALTSSYGIAQQSKVPGKQFTRSDILAILRAQRAVAGNVADSEYQKLLSIFENLE